MYFSQESLRNEVAILEKMKHPHIVSTSLSYHCKRELVTQSLTFVAEAVGLLRATGPLLHRSGVFRWWGVVQSYRGEDLFQ